MSQSNNLHTMDTFTRFFQENQAKFLSFAYSYIRNKTEAEMYTDGINDCSLGEPR